MKNPFSEGHSRVRVWGKRAAVIFCTAAAVLFILALSASHGAAFIFNRVMADQSVVKGTITINTLSADIRGRVNFTDLEWNTPDGKRILYVPSGSFRVNPWDFILHKRIKTTTLREITLNDSVVSVQFDKNMQADIIPHPDDAENGGGTPKTLDEKLRNLNVKGKKFNLLLTLNNCRFEAYHENRYYAMSSVDASIRLKSNEVLSVDFASGPFQGTSVGDGITVQGRINLRPDMPELDLSVNFLNVDPSSLGFGRAIHDPLTLKTYFTGPAAHPQAAGKLSMEKLSIPALDFTNVNGDITYNDGIFTFTNVTADVYNGKLTAHGDYDISTRAYHIWGRGTGLDSRVALKRIEFKCFVDMDITMECDGNPEDLLTYGTFSSGKGHYSLIHFNSITGSFSNRRRHLDFYDIAINTKFGLITTDALHIINGHVVLSDINVVFPGELRTFNLFSPNSSDDTWQNTKENMKAARENIKSLKEGMRRFKNTEDQLKEDINAVKENKRRIKESLHRAKSAISS